MPQQADGTDTHSLTDLGYEKTDGIAKVTFNRPERMNAYRLTTLRELAAVLNDSASDASLGVLLITGTGRSFCVGEDLKDLAATLEGSGALEQIASHLNLVQSLTSRMVNHPKPIIAAVNGFAIGGGAELAVAADIRIASENATFAFVEAIRGLFPTNGVHYLLPRLVGDGRALEMLLTGRTVSAAEALSCGLVTQVTAAEQLLPVALELASTIASNAALSVRLIKKTLRLAHQQQLETTLQWEADSLLQCCAGQDLVKTIRDFLEKRSRPRDK